MKNLGKSLKLKRIKCNERLFWEIDEEKWRVEILRKIKCILRGIYIKMKINENKKWKLNVKRILLFYFVMNLNNVM